MKLFGAPGKIRTSDPRFRKPVLYPTELRAHKFSLRYLLLHFHLAARTGFLNGVARMLTSVRILLLLRTYMRASLAKVRPAALSY